MITFIFVVCVSIGFGIPAKVFLENKLFVLVILLAVIGGLWIVGFVKAIRVINYIGFVTGTIANSVLAWLNEDPWFPIVGLIAGLLAWDLCRILMRVKLFSPKGYKLRLLNTHLRKIGPFSVLTLLLSLGSSYVQFYMSFLAAIMLILSLLTGLLLMLQWFRTHGQTMD